MSQYPNDGEYWKRCESGICSQIEMYKGIGRRYIVRAYHKEIERKWCPTCIRITETTEAQTMLTADMIRGVYRAYREGLTNPIALSALEDYTQTIFKYLGQEL